MLRIARRFRSRRASETVPAEKKRVVAIPRHVFVPLTATTQYSSAGTPPQAFKEQPLPGILWCQAGAVGRLIAATRVFSAGVKLGATAGLLPTPIPQHKAIVVCRTRATLRGMPEALLAAIARLPLSASWQAHGSRFRPKPNSCLQNRATRAQASCGVSFRDPS
jgi:hypothetical protein